MRVVAFNGSARKTRFSLRVFNEPDAIRKELQSSPSELHTHLSLLIKRFYSSDAIEDVLPTVTLFLNMTAFSIESYVQGIYRAYEEGRITFADRYVPESGQMQFSNHISWEINGVHYEGGLSFTNTRPLFDGIRLALDYFKGNPVRFLELGPGAGNACYELHCLAKTMGIDVDIHTVSYTPINPYMPLLLSGDRLLRRLASNPNLKIMEKTPHGCSWYILDEDVFRMPDEEIVQIYGKLDESYIHHQYIGYFTQEIGSTFRWI